MTDPPVEHFRQAPEPRPAPHPGIVDALGDGLYVVTPDRMITHWNPAAARITGYEAAEAIGRWCGDGLLNHVDEQGKPLCGLRCPLVATMRDGERRTMHAFLHHKEGHVVPIRVTAAPLREADGTIIGAVETFSDDTELITIRERLTAAQQASLTDALTGLGNRRFFDQDLDRRLALWARDEQVFALIAADIDAFKGINDTRGHQFGDQVLQIVARSMAAAVRGTDTVFRTGGDEFAVLAGPITQQDLAVLAARLAMVVPAGRYEGGKPGVRVTITVGCAIVHPGDDAETLRSRADGMLYAAKRARPAEAAHHPA